MQVQRNTIPTAPRQANPTNPLWSTALASGALLLAACGGGGGGDAAPPPPPPAPRVVAALPADGDIEVALDAVLTVEFDLALEPTSVNERSVELTDAAGPVAGLARTSADALAVEFVPDGELLPNTSYTLSLSEEITGANGAPIAPLTQRFATETRPPAAVVDTVPDQGQSGVAPDVRLSVTFDGDLDGSTVGPATVSLEGSAGDVAGSAFYDAESRSVRFLPDSDLALGRGYTLRLSSDIEGANRVAIEEFALDFTTATPAPTPPRVVVTSPANGATDVSVGVDPFAIFDADIEASTVPGSVELLGPGGPVTGNAAAVAPRKLEFVPLSDLAPGADYTVLLKSTIRGTNGANIGEFSFAFRTADEPQNPPQVVASNPADGEEGVSVTITPAVTFDADIDASTVAGSVELLGPGGEVPGNALATGPRELTFFPIPELAPGSAHTLVLRSTLEGTDGAPIAETAISFETIGRPSISLVSPADGDTDVPRDITVEIVFDVPMSSSSVLAPGAIRLLDGGETVDADVSLDPVNQQVVSVAPTETLRMLGEYELRVAGSVESEDGISLGSSETFSFETQDGDWDATSVAVSFEVPNTDAQPHVALSSNGEATAVLRDIDIRVVGARNQADSTVWELTSIDDHTGIHGMRVATDDLGRAIAVWGFQTEIRVNRFDGGWLLFSELLSGGTRAYADPEIAMTSDGSAIVAWPHRIDNIGSDDTYNIAYRLFQSGSWSAVQNVLGTDLADPILEFALGMGEDKSPVVAFTKRDGGQYRIHATHALDPFSAGLFAPVFPIDDTALSQDDAIDITLAVSGGTALASWVQNSQTGVGENDWRNRLWANRLDLSSGAWDQPQLIDETGEKDSYDPAAALSADGTIGMVIWRQDAIVGRDKLGAHKIDTRVPLALGLTEPELLDTGIESAFPNAKPFDLELALDRRGNGIALYRLETFAGIFDVVARRFVEKSDTWSEAEAIEVIPQSASRPRLSMTPSGEAIAIWHAYSFGNDARVDANRFE